MRRHYTGFNPPCRRVPVTGAGRPPNPRLGVPSSEEKGNRKSIVTHAKRTPLRIGHLGQINRHKFTDSKNAFRRGTGTRRRESAADRKSGTTPARRSGYDSRRSLGFLFAVIAVFGLNVVLGNFLGLDVALVRVWRVFHALDHARFKCLTLFDEFRDAFGIHVFDAGKTLNITRLPAALQCHALMDASATPEVFADTSRGPFPY